MNPPSDYFYDAADGLRLYCRIYAPRLPCSAVPVLCLPGLTRNSRDFATLATHLSAQREVLAADLRGRGHSARDPDASHYELAVYVRDVLTLLDTRGIGRVIIIGTSLGALLGMLLVAQHGARIAGLVLNDAGPELDPAGVRRIAGYAGKLPPVRSWAEAAAQARSVYGIALPGFTDEQWLEYARRCYRENAEGVPVPDIDPKIAVALKSSPKSAPDLWPLWGLLGTVPVLAIRGALSDLLSAAAFERMAREKPDLLQLTVPNRGHTPLLEEPECLAAIDAFLARYG